MFIIFNIFLSDGSCAQAFWVRFLGARDVLSVWSDKLRAGVGRLNTAPCNMLRGQLQQFFFGLVLRPPFASARCQKQGTQCQCNHGSSSALAKVEVEGGRAIHHIVQKRSRSNYLSSPTRELGRGRVCVKEVQLIRLDAKQQ